MRPRPIYNGMNPLQQKLESELKDAMKAKKELKLSVLRMLSAALHNKEIEKRTRGKEPELTEEETISVLRSELKKRKDAALGFAKGGRADMAKKEEDEAGIIASYLPSELSDEEIEKIIGEVISGLGEVSAKDFGKVIGEVMKRVKGRAAGDRVSAMVRKRIEK